MERRCRAIKPTWAFKDGKVAEIGKLNANDGKKTIDASGLIVAPGFIDLHTH